MPDATPTHHHLGLGPLVYELDRRQPPALVVEPGDLITVETEDAFSGQIRRPSDRRNRTVLPDSNPVAGPISVSGARPGDALSVEILSIEPLLGQCSTYVWPYEYFLSALGTDVEHQTRICAIEGDDIVWDENTRIPYAPMIGVIGTAPAKGVPTTDPAGDHGGNLDLPEIRPGATVLLPVAVDGAQFFLGDCHANQGDGEFTAAALEMPARVTIRIGVAPGPIPGPRLETPTAIGAVSVEPNLEAAIASAYGRLARWLETDYSWNRWEVASLLGQVGVLSIGYFRFGIAAALIERRYLSRTGTTHL